MMPLFSLGQHRALEEVARRLTPGEHFLAFLGVFVEECSIRIHVGKTQLWCRNQAHCVRSSREGRSGIFVAH